jgi:hypothetical protein
MPDVLCAEYYADPGDRRGFFDSRDGGEVTSDDATASILGTPWRVYQRIKSEHVKKQAESPICAKFIKTLRCCELVTCME